MGKKVLKKNPFFQFYRRNVTWLNILKYVSPFLNMSNKHHLRIIKPIYVIRNVLIRDLTILKLEINKKIKNICISIHNILFYSILKLYIFFQLIFLTLIWSWIID